MRGPKSYIKYIKYTDHFFTFFYKYYIKDPVAVDGILRIDCIYSENFDRIFIGKVKLIKMKNHMFKLLNLEWIL